MEELRQTGGTTDENAITTAMLWAFWELSRTPARIQPLHDGPTNLLGIFKEVCDGSPPPPAARYGGGDCSWCL